MRTKWLGLAAALLILSSTTAHALYRRWGKGDPQHPISASFWPKGASELANRADRFDSYMLNAFDRFYYAGDAKAFNDFLQGYAKVDDRSLELLLIDPTDKLLLGNQVEGANWSLSISSNSHASVAFPVDGRIQLRDLKVPLSVNVQAYPDANAEIKAFIAAHETLQKPKAPARTSP